MIALLWLIVGLQWAAFIYFPVVCFIGLITALASKSPMSVIMNPYFGIFHISQNKAIAIWSFRLLILGSILIEYIHWYREGINPFIIL